MKLFVRKCINLDMVEVFQKSTMLHIAIKRQHVDMVAFLLENGVDPSYPDANDNTVRSRISYDKNVAAKTSRF